MSGIEYIQDNLETHPECIHGPTFLFERTTAKGTTRFYACSACRDRKDCSFFLPEEKLDKTNTEKAENVLREQKKTFTSEIDHKILFKTLNQVQNTPENKRRYCATCNKFLIIDNHDTTHKVICGITDTQLNFPTKFLKPLENDKVEAQYLFDEAAIKTTVQIIKEFKFKYVLCIGTPRIFEYIRSNCKDMQCLLLDFDKRYHNFFSPNEFCWYNLFNNYLFFSECKQILTNFLKQSNDNIILLIDPPFGGRLEPISQTIYSIENEIKILNNSTKSLPIMFYFPYFMEQHFNNHLPTLKMADYKVNYENHFLFSDGKKSRKYGSAVRIFTNLDLKKLKFDENSYRFCDICERYVYNENNHCYLCNSCTSKDGRTYVHCNKCKKCVKPTWKHCLKCKKCTQPDHKCGEIEFNQSCFHCHKKGHKKNNCPTINVDQVKRKRKEKYMKNKMLKVN